MNAKPRIPKQEPEVRRAESDCAGPRIHSLRDGHVILVRPLLPSDRDQLAAGYAALSPAARRLRFGPAPDQLSPHALDLLLDLDYDNRYALAAVAVDEPGEPGVGVARYVRHSDDPSLAEVAVIVREADQRRGIGSILLWDLVAAARAHGVTTLTGTVLWESTGLLAAVRSAGATIEPAEPGVATVRFQIPDGPADPGSDHGRPRGRSRHWSR